MLSRSFLTVGLLLLASVPATLAQESFGEVVEVELVNVEVWASDRDGSLVTGLAPGDFVVLHDGEPVEISHFLEVRNGRPAPRPSGLATPDPEPGHLIVYFDQLRLQPTSYGPLVESLLEFLETGSVPPERVLVFRQDRELYVEAPLGSSREQLREALIRLAESDTRSAGLDNSKQQALDEIQSSWRQAEGLAGSRVGGLASVPTTGGPPSSDPIGGTSPQAATGGGSVMGSDPCDIFLQQVESIVDGWARSKSQRLTITLSHLSETGVFLAGMPGVKTFLYLSDGLEAQPGAAFASYVGSLCPTGSTGSMMSVLLEELTRSMTELTRHLNSNRVTVYSLQAGGLKGSLSGSASSGGASVGGGQFRAANAFEAANRASERDGLAVLASETGGRAVFNQNRFTEELAQIGREMGTYYSLAYSPPESGKGSEHRIEVRLREHDHELRYRRGYLEKDHDQWMAERLEGALNLGLVSNALGIGLGAGKIRPSEGDKKTLPLHIFVPVASLAFLPEGELEYAQISVQVQARHLQSQRLERVKRRYRARRDPGSTDERIGFALEIELVPGSHAVAVGLQDSVTRQSSFISTTVEIPEGG